MENDRADMLIFIDLGFILLVGFLMLTETESQAEVVLPSESQEASAPSLAYEVQFDDRMHFMMLWLPERIEACSPATLVELAACMEQAWRLDSQVSFVLAPQGRATVQQMVAMLDLCTRRSWRCTVSN